MIRDFALSLIRTYIPLIVGSGLTWLGSSLDVVITDEMSSGATALAVAVLSGLYYATARVLESRYPWLSFLLATPPSTATPHYANAKTIPGEVVRGGRLVSKAVQPTGRGR